MDVVAFQDMGNDPLTDACFVFTRGAAYGSHLRLDYILLSITSVPDCNDASHIMVSFLP